MTGLDPHRCCNWPLHLADLVEPRGISGGKNFFEEPHGAYSAGASPNDLSKVCQVAPLIEETFKALLLECNSTPKDLHIERNRRRHHAKAVRASALGRSDD